MEIVLLKIEFNTHFEYALVDEETEKVICIDNDLSEEEEKELISSFHESVNMEDCDGYGRYEEFPEGWEEEAINTIILARKEKV